MSRRGSCGGLRRPGRRRCLPGFVLRRAARLGRLEVRQAMRRTAGRERARQLGNLGTPIGPMRTGRPANLETVRPGTARGLLPQVRWTSCLSKCWEGFPRRSIGRVWRAASRPSPVGRGVRPRTGMARRGGRLRRMRSSRSRAKAALVWRRAPGWSSLLRSRVGRRQRGWRRMKGLWERVPSSLSWPAQAKRTRSASVTRMAGKSWSSESRRARQVGAGRKTTVLRAPRTRAAGKVHRGRALRAQRQRPRRGWARPLRGRSARTVSRWFGAAIHRQAAKRRRSRVSTLRSRRAISLGANEP